MTTHPWTAHYQHGVPAEIDLPTRSLVDMFDDACEEAGDAPALTFFGATLSYREFADQVARAAAGLRRLGVAPGDRVAIIVPNCPQHMVAFYAVLRIGAVVVEHNPLYTAAELGELFADHGAEVAICWDVAVWKIAGIGLRCIISVNLTEAMPVVKRCALRLPIPRIKNLRAGLTAPAPGTFRWKILLTADPIDDVQPRPSVDDLAVIQYTSGTTGVPKGAMLTHFNLYSNALQGEAWMHDAEYRREVFYALLPMFHAFGMTLYVTYGVLKQAHIVLFPQFDVDMVLDEMTKRPATVYCAVPPIYAATAKRAAERGVSLRSCRYCISGAMALTDDIVDVWETQTGWLLVEGYGMTEASPVALGNPFCEQRKTGTIGIPFPSTERRVVDVEDVTREVEVGEPGELLIRGPQVFGGYWNNEAETAAMLMDDGWLRTGDVVTLDEDGFATIVDRVKELIIIGGFNVSPSEVERVLRRHDAIADAAVVGLPDGGGEQVTAVIEVAEGAQLPELEEIRAFCKEFLAAYKVPRAVHVVDELPRSLLGKVVRKQVRDAVLTDR